MMDQHITGHIVLDMYIFKSVHQMENKNQLERCQYERELLTSFISPEINLVSCNALPPQQATVMTNRDCKGPSLTQGTFEDVRGWVGVGGTSRDAQ